VLPAGFSYSGQKEKLRIEILARAVTVNVFVSLLGHRDLLLAALLPDIADGIRGEHIPGNRAPGRPSMAMHAGAVMGWRPTATCGSRPAGRLPARLR